MNGERATVLLVDDDPVHRMRVRDALEEADYRVEEAESGEDGLEVLARGGHDAVLLDIEMPGIGGLDVLAAMRAMPAARSLPVLMVTGLDGEAVIESAFELGAYDYITKPINDAVLRQRVRAMLRARANQRKLAISEQRLSTIVQNLAGYAVYMLDREGRIASWNSGAEALTGFAAEAVLGLDYRVFAPEGVPAGEPAGTALLHGIGEDGAQVREGWRKRLSGTQFYAEESINPLYDEAGKPFGFACIVRDRTRERALEEQLRQAQKLEAIGQLTGGLAHDFNNLLCIVIGNIDLCRSMSGAEELRELLDDTLDAALRGAELTSRLLTFARRQSLVTDLFDVNDLVGGMRRLLGLTLGDHIGLDFVPGESVWPVKIDRSQLEASILNLATNARDAMPEGGRLSVSTTNRTISQEAAVEPNLVPGDYVVVEVSDTGAGMSEEVIAKIFEPFFTTKPSGLGTGLGLSMVFGFVAQSGGFVRVRSAPKSGATFSLYFPRATESVRQRTLPAELAVTHSARGETVLAVEDEVALLRVVERELIELGFRVRTAADGEAALAILEREEIDILLSDVVMPGAVDGFALAETVRGRWPAIRIVLTSGYLGTGNDLYDRRWKRMENFVSLLRKPYRRRELAAALHGVAIRPQAEARGAP